MPWAVLSVAVMLMGQASASPYGWPRAVGNAETLEARFAPPAGFERLRVESGAFGAWSRGLPLYPGRPEVMLFDGRPKRNQTAQLAVIDIDVGARDLQQCADAVMRLWAEHRWGRGDVAALCIPLTSGDPIPWRRWKSGDRPVVEGRRVRWSSAGTPSGDHAAFRRYLDFVFIYAGSASLQRYMVDRVTEDAILPGDTFVQGGFPGHAVIVLDVAQDAKGRRVFALAQSYMPAQQIHVLDNPASPGSPWYSLRSGEKLVTPEWTFPPHSLRRFKAVGEMCR
jgi:hypothetical protein